MSREFDIDCRISALIGTLVERGWSSEEESEFRALSRERTLRMYVGRRVRSGTRRMAPLSETGVRPS